MKHEHAHRGGEGRGHRRHGPDHEGSGGGGRRGRPFDYGDMRLLVLTLISEEPRHGYELIRAIEERMGGSYAPSPGVIYPTLAWLEDMGYATVEPEQNGRKRYSITQEGGSFLALNKATVDGLLARLGQFGGRFAGVPAPILRGMENLKLALRLRLKGGPVEDSAVETIAAALDAAARAVEQSK